MYLMTELRKMLDEQQKAIKVGFRAGDTVSVYIPMIQKGKEVNKIFTGVCIRARKNTFSIRKVSNENAVEINFSTLLPTKVTVDNCGKVKQSRIYYWRELQGKKARIKKDFNRNRKAAQ